MSVCTAMNVEITRPPRPRDPMMGTMSDRNRKKTRVPMKAAMMAPIMPDQMDPVPGDDDGEHEAQPGLVGSTNRVLCRRLAQNHSRSGGGRRDGARHAGDLEHAPLTKMPEHQVGTGR